MISKKLVAALGSVALVASAIAVQPAMAQPSPYSEDDDDLGLWLAAGGFTAALILFLVLAHKKNNPPPVVPVSP